MTLDPCNCLPFVGSTIIDTFNRSESGQWGIPSRGVPAWVDYSHAETYSSTSTVGVSSVGPSTGWGRITLSLTKPSTSPAVGASRELQLEIPEVTSLDEFRLAFDLVVNPLLATQGIAFAQIRLGGTGNAPVNPMLDLPIQFQHFSPAGSDLIRLFLSRDSLGGVEHTVTQTIATATHSFDGTVVIDRSVSRGSTLVTVGPFGTYEYAPISPAGTSGTPERKLYVSYHDDSSDALSGAPSTFSIDNLTLLRGGAVTPLRNQPVIDEFVGIGDGVTTSWTTHWPYISGSLDVTVAGMIAEIDMSDPAGAGFELINPAPHGGKIHATYRAVGI